MRWEKNGKVQSEACEGKDAKVFPYLLKLTLLNPILDSMLR